jgi:preprotein translocase subunit SecG
MIMDTLVLVVHVLAALSIVGLILLQQGKGASMGASFGSGASQTVFGSAGGGSFLVKVTAVIALVFFITSFSLAVIAKRRAAPEEDIGLPGFDQEVPAIEQPADQPSQSEIPVVEESVNTPAAEIPAVEETEAAEPEISPDAEATTEEEQP